LLLLWQPRQKTSLLPLANLLLDGLKLTMVRPQIGRLFLIIN